MSNLTILNSSIRQLDNLYSLNDLHLASGNDPKHRPSLFARNEQTKSLVSEIENERSTKTIFALRTVRGGSDITKQGTWGCKEIVIAYAAWISPQFHLVVLRAFLDKLEHSQKIQPNLPLIEEKTHTLTLTDRELHRLCWLWKMAEIMRQLIGFVQKPLELLGSRYAASAWGYSNEYKFSLEKTRQILVRETAHVQPDPLDRHGWNNVIHELRSGKIR